MKSILVALVGFVVVAAANGCSSPTVSVLRGYTTTDASVLSAIAFVSEFDLKCNGSPPPASSNFYAEVGGRHMNVVRTNKGSYQVSWTEEIPKASRGDYKINIYDEDTFPQVRKGKGELPAPLVSLTLNHPGAYTGPWLSSEHLAAILGVFVVYIALSSRSKLLS